MDVKSKSGKSAEKSESSLKKNKERAAAFIKSLFFGTIYAAVGYFLGGAVLPYGATPFGIGFLAVASRRVFYIYAGLCVYAWHSSARVLLLSVYTLVLLLRLASRITVDTVWDKEAAKNSGDMTLGQIYPSLFSEKLWLRAAAAAVGALCIGIYRLAEGGMMYYDMYGAVVSAVVAPLFVLLVSGLYIKNAGKYRRLVSFIALAFAVIYFLGESQFYGIWVGAAICLFITLYITKRGGTVLGIISGGLLGLAVSIDLVPLFAFAALVGGILLGISLPLAVFGASSVAIGWGIYTRGLGILNGLASAIVVSAVAFAVWDKLFEHPQTHTEKESTKDVGLRSEMLSMREIERARADDTLVRLHSAGESFRSTSEMLFKISENLRTPGTADIRQICDNAFDASCVSCENKNLCWREEYRQTTETISRLCRIVRERGSLTIDDGGDALISRCSRFPDILSEINHNTFLHTRELLEGDRTEVFALDYGVVSELMIKTAELDPAEYEPDSFLAEKIKKELLSDGIEILSAAIWGKRKRRIVLFFDKETEVGENKGRIYSTVSEICSFPIDDGIIDIERRVISFSEKESFSVVTAQRNLCAQGEDRYCGDTSGIFRSEDGRFYSFISDGMGAGREAAITSGIAALFIRNFLMGGCGCESVLKLINGFLRNRGNGSIHECSATVDIMELDLISGSAHFYKSGAAPTYVFRNGSLLKLRSHTVPVGIIREIDTRQIDFDVSCGDVVVMVSDGVTDGKEECAWLFDLLRSQGSSASPDRIADLVVKYAKAEGATDDISVIVIKIE